MKSKPYKPEFKAEAIKQIAELGYVIVEVLKPSPSNT